MKAGRISKVAAILTALAFCPVSLLAASVPNFPPNPVGEKLYREQMYHDMLLPVVIIAGALVAAIIAHAFGRRHEHEQTAAENARVTGV